jgi:uncharacterized protein (DUF2249 family)
MSDIVILTSEADARAAEAVEAHHAQMSGALTIHVEALVAAAARSELLAAERARQLLADWCNEELLPHAHAEEQALYPAARATTKGRLLAEAMLEEHRLIRDLVRALEDGTGGPVRAAAAAGALRAVFELHLAKENRLVLPLLAATPGVSVAALLEGMHDLLGDESGQANQDDPSGCGGHTCSCGEQQAEGYPELDARSIPHAIRHATIFGALDTVAAGGGLVLVAPHDPIPLLGQIDERWPGRFTVEYLENGPQRWRLALTRSAA